MKIMKIFLRISLSLSLLFLINESDALSQPKSTKKTYEPTFESLEKANPVPEWFKDAKFGIYFHWGVYSVPAFANEWYPRSMFIIGSPENKHHTEKYGDITEWP
ncbi:MAG: alpha-L-fucosidase, partial [Bacteroidales bacterium]|nr:alpha-L-fucosidase [Bacteroidales bacterium]